MNYRTLVVVFLKILFVSALTVSLADAEPYIFKGSPFPLELTDGTVLTITSIEIQADGDGRQMYIYQTDSGAEGYKWQDQIANVDQLMKIVSPSSSPSFSEPVEESTDQDSAQESAGTESSSTASPEKEFTRTDILDRCEQQWGTGNEMAEDCVALQSEAAGWLEEKYGGRSELPKAEYRIVNGCAKKWSNQIKEKPNLDYAKIKDCIEQQMKVYKGE